MAQKRPDVPVATRRALIAEAGGKCANPGCPDRLVEVHHIHEWAAYQTHDAEHMVAICPACHDQVTRGKLRITDEECYRWKGISRASEPYVGQIFVEPVSGPLLPGISLGSIFFVGSSGIKLFDFAAQTLSLEVREENLVFLNLKLMDPVGHLLVDVVDNYIRQRDPAATIEHRTGRWLVRGELTSTYFPEWVLEILGRSVPDYAVRGVDLLDVEVESPGRLRVAGVWLDDDRGFVVDHERILILSRRRNAVVAFFGPGAQIVSFGDLDQSIFDMFGEARQPE